MREERITNRRGMYPVKESYCVVYYLYKHVQNKRIYFRYEEGDLYVENRCSLKYAAYADSYSCKGVEYQLF